MTEITIIISGGVFGLPVPCFCQRSADKSHEGNNGTWIDIAKFANCYSCMDWCCNQKGNGEYTGIAYAHKHTITSDDSGICGELSEAFSPMIADIRKLIFQT